MYVCLANSRDGQMTSPVGPSPSSKGNFNSASIANKIIGKQNTNVLPVTEKTKFTKITKKKRSFHIQQKQIQQKECFFLTTSCKCNTNNISS